MTEPVVPPTAADEHPPHPEPDPEQRALAPDDPEGLVMPAPSPAPRATVGSSTTVVIEEGVFPSRLRRPRDLGQALLSVGSALLVVALAMAAQRTTLALDDDLAQAKGFIPALVWGVLSLLAGLGLLLLPLAAGVGMLLRRRGRQLLEAFAALTLATIALSGLSVLIRDHGTDTLKRALTGQAGDALTFPTNPLLGGLVAFAVTARLFSRPRWNVLAWVTIGSAALVNTGAADTTVAAQIISVLIGAAIGLLVRYALGTPTTRPTGTAVAEALVRGGLPIVVMRARGGTDSGRHYRAVTAGGDRLDVVVLDRDLEGSGLATTLWRAIRLRGPEPATTLSMRAQVERASMMAYAAEAAGVPTPRLRLAASVSSDSALLAYEKRGGRIVAPTPLPADARGSEPATAITTDATDPDVPVSLTVSDDELDAAWRAVAAMQARSLAHQDLQVEAIRYDGADTYLTGLEEGTVAAGDVLLRLDIAEMLVATSLQAGVPRAVAAARRTIGDELVSRALPVLQRVAMPRATRIALRSRKSLLNDLRTTLLDINPGVEAEPPIDLERLKPRTLITLVLGTVAVYLLLSQLAQVDIVEVVREADWRWAIAALVLSGVTYVGAALALTGFIPDGLSFGRTFQAQLAASFATLVSPPTLGAVAVNARYLNRAGLPPAAAAATVGVSQLAAFMVHTFLLIVVGLAAGTQADLAFNPPRGVIIGAGVAATTLAGLASLSQVRAWLARRLRPISQQVFPRLVTVAQQPRKLLEGFGGILLLNAAYCLCLVSAVRAFSETPNIAAICFVYLAGSTIGQAAPTPGGLGVVEAALSAGLTAAGMDSALAVSAVLLFRAVTFWLPVIPGWFCFRDLTQRQLL